MRGMRPQYPHLPVHLSVETVTGQVVVIHLEDALNIRTCVCNFKKFSWGYTPDPR